jgi:spermidine synthase
MTRAVILILFFLSGLTGLLYEIVWTRIFGLIFGNTTVALSTVLAAFMLGLAAGGMILGRRTDRIQNPLRMYALLELGVAVTALFVPLLRNPLADLFAGLFALFSDQMLIFHLIKFVIAFALMLPATFLMGGTLPILSRATVVDRDRLGIGVGRLYGVNTVGAMLGCFLAGFVFIRWLGVSNSIYFGVGVNIAIAAMAWLLSRRTAPVSPASVDEIAPAKTTDAGSPIVQLVMIAIGISGFVALAYEVLWTRVLVFVLTNSVYAMTVMLTTMLAGIGVGSYFGGRLADRSKNLLAVFGWIEVAIGLSALAAAFVLINLPSIHDQIFTIKPDTSWWFWNGIRFLEAALVMFLPALFMGAAFPVAGKIVVPDLRRIGSKVGRLYFYNTVGGTLGSLLTGFILVSALGSSVTVATMVVINLLLGVYFIVYQKRSLETNATLGYVAAGIAILFLAIQVTPTTIFTVAYSHTERDFQLVDYREGVEGTVTVHEQKRPLQTTKRIDVDGLNVAGTSFMLRTLQTLQGHVPLLVHPNPQAVLQIGFGTGETSKSALRHPLENFHLVEISKNVLELSDHHFQELNEGVLRHPKFEYSILDGKNFVRYSGEKYDVIMNDANYAVATSSASLFTRDHFENCRQRLRPGGIVSTWMTIDLHPDDFAIVLKTFQSVFPHCALWMAPNCINKQIVLMGSDQPWQIDFLKLDERISSSEIERDFAAINIGSAYDFLDCLLLDADGIKQISQNAPVNSDKHPILEFSTRDIRSRDLCSYLNLGKILVRKPNVASYLTNLPNGVVERQNVEEKLARHADAQRLFLQGMLAAYQGRTPESLNTLMAGSRLIPESNLAKEFFERIDVIGTQLMVEAGQNREDLNAQLNVVRHLISLGKYEEALKILRPIEEVQPDHPLIHYEKARCFLGTAQLDSAKAEIEKGLAIYPKFAGGLYLRGELKFRNGELDLALDDFQRSLQLDSRFYEAQNAIGRIHKKGQKYQAAVTAFQTSLQMMEYQPAVWADLADCFLQLNQSAAAIRLYQQALDAGQMSSKLLFNLGNGYYYNREFANASAAYRHALRLDSLDAEIYYNLGNALMMQKKIHEASESYALAVEINPSEPDYFNNLALSYRELGKSREATEVFERGLKRHPNSKLLLENYASLRD